MSRTVSFMATLHDGRVATVYTDGRVLIAPPPTMKASRSVPAAAIEQRMRRMHPMQMRIEPLRYGLGAGNVSAFTRNRIVFDLEHPPVAYVPNRVIVVLKQGISSLRNDDRLDAASASALRLAAIRRTRGVVPHAFTTDARTNATLFRVGADRMQRLFTGVGTGTVQSLRARAEAALHRQLLPLENAYVVHVGGASVRSAVQQLRSLGSVAYAAPDRTVGSMIASQVDYPSDDLKAFASYHRGSTPFGRAIAATSARPTLPTNTSLAVSQQALLNAPGVDAAAAFDEIARAFGQLPGAGEIITNVSLGDADDASAANNPNDPCNQTVSSYGGTTHRIGGQRYLDWPGMPLIPVWVADPDGRLSGTAEVCNVDPLLGEVGLDFSMMAALPDAEQRAAEPAPAGGDLLGIAPGASYRLVMPQGSGTGAIGESDILGAFMGAATQAPVPNVITASIGFGLDSLGFPSRYLEDDPLAESVIAAIVNASNVVVCISANDGTREYTVAPIGPSGGSAATNVGPAGTTTTADDMAYSTAPSVDLDSGAIDAGASTLDDIIAANPADPRNAGLANTKTFAETRYDGMLAYSSGFGSRVSIAAPGDNVAAYMKNGTAYDAIGAFITGGTSAAAPEIAASAAVALQVARLTGRPFSHATDVRALLQSTGTPVATPPNSDVPLNVGPQVSVRRAVEQLLANAGKPVVPGVARVAIQSRNNAVTFSAYGVPLFDSIFQTGVDPAFIKLDGPWQTNAPDPMYRGSDTGASLRAYITIAPDWEGLPANAQYRLYVAGHPGQLIATTPYVRILPTQLLAAAGLSTAAGISRSIRLTYEATSGLRSLARTTFQLTFGPPAPSSRVVFAPRAPAVVTGPSFQVSYDLTGYPTSLLAGPRLNVSLPGETTLIHQVGGIYPLYSVPLTGATGTVTIPTSALAGGGVYTVWIAMRPDDPTLAGDRSDAAFIRVANAGGAVRPPAPILAASGSSSAPGHTIDVPYGAHLAVTYDVSSVAGATGALLELSAPPPGSAFVLTWTGWNMFDNPNGDRIDDDGVDTGSVYHVVMSGTRGAATIDLSKAGVPPTNYDNVRVFPMRGASVVGEASDFSTFYYHGIDPVVPVPVDTTILNPQGADGGIVAQAQISGTTAATLLLQQFDITSATVTGVPLEGTPVLWFSPIVQNDLDLAIIDPALPSVGTLYADYPFATAGAFSQTAYPVPSGPAGNLPWAIAPQSSATRAAYLYYQLPTFAPYVIRGDFESGTQFSAPVNISSAIEPTDDFAWTNTLTYDPVLDRAYFLTTPAGNACYGASPALVTVDFATGSVTRRTLNGIVAAYGGLTSYALDADSTTHAAIVATTCQRQADFSVFTDLAMLDLRSGAIQRILHRVYTQAEIAAHGFAAITGDAATIAVDRQRGLVLQESISCPAKIDVMDDHARPCLNVYDESGRLVKTSRGLFSDGPFQPGEPALSYALRRGAAPSDEDESSFFLQYLSVQPYEY